MCAILGIERYYVGEKRYIPTCTSLSTSLHYQYTNGYTTGDTEVTLRAYYNSTLIELLQDLEQVTLCSLGAKTETDCALAYPPENARVHGGKAVGERGDTLSRQYTEIRLGLSTRILVVLTLLSHPNPYYPSHPSISNSIRFHQYLLEILFIVLIKALIDDQHSLRALIQVSSEFYDMLNKITYCVSLKSAYLARYRQRCWYLRSHWDVAP